MADMMNQYKIKILSKLLDEYERKGFNLSDNVKDIKISFAKYLKKDYYDEFNYNAKESIDDALRFLWKMNFIMEPKKKFIRRTGTDEYDKIYLNPEKINDIYVFLSRSPVNEIISERIKLLDKLYDTDWIFNFKKEVKKCILDNKIPKYLPNDDIDRKWINIFSAINSLRAGENVNLPVRIFSQKLFGDSKLFEKEVKVYFLHILKDFFISDCDFDKMSDDDILDCVGIQVNKPSVSFSGFFVICIGGNKIDISTIPGGITINIDAVDNIDFISVPDSVYTIENLTNFQKLSESSISETGYIYTGGWPNKAVQKLLYKMYFFKSDCNYYHWGDLDYAGIAICLKMKEYVPTFKSYNMNEKIYKSFLKYGQKISSNNINKLQILLEKVNDPVLYDLIKIMVKEKLWIEQEIML